MTKIYFRVDISDALVGELMQVIRDFDLKHDPNRDGKVHVESLMESNFPVEKMEAVFKQIEPPFPYTAVHKFDEWPISKYVGKRPHGNWEFVETFNGTEKNCGARLRKLQATADLSGADEQYRHWDCR